MLSAVATMPYSNNGAIPAVSAWIESILTGQVALVLATIGVACFGLLMMGGQLPLRRGGRTVLGCFILLGASTIASALVDLAGSSAQSTSSISANASPAPLRPPPIPVQQRPDRGNPFDPYSNR